MAVAILLTIVGVFLGGVASYVVNMMFAARSLPRRLDLNGEWVGIYQAPRRDFAWVPESVEIQKSKGSYYFSTSENPDGDPIMARVLGGTEQYIVGEWWSGRQGSPARGGFILMVEHHGNIMYGVATHSLSTGYFHGGWVLARKDSPTLEEDLHRARNLLTTLNKPLAAEFRELAKKSRKE